jgi:hypothetical protein
MIADWRGNQHRTLSAASKKSRARRHCAADVGIDELVFCRGQDFRYHCIRIRQQLGFKWVAFYWRLAGLNHRRTR